MSKEDIDGVLEKIKELLPQEDGFFLKKKRLLNFLKKNLLKNYKLFGI